MARTKPTAGTMTRIVCALALLLLGFSHQPPAFANGLSLVEAAHYVLPDGSLPDICDDSGTLSGDGHDHSPLHANARCEACLISASTLVPPPPGDIVVPRREAGRLLPAALERPSLVAFRLTAAPRGPPAHPLA